MRKPPRLRQSTKAVKTRERKSAPSVGAASAPVALTKVPSGYAAWLTELKSTISDSRRRVAVAANTDMVRLYWQIGHGILERQAARGWGAKVIERLAHDLHAAFPDMRGFSRANLMYMRAFAEAWPNSEIVQQLVGQLSWGTNLVLLTRLKTAESRRFYAEHAIERGWSRNVLQIQIESGLLERQGKATTNFAARLPTPHATLAVQTLKDPYFFDFLGVGLEADERAIESALVTHITRFLLELGAGFAFVGRQVHLEVGGDDFFLDLLFFHLKLRCYVVVELKAGAFKPEHAGQLNFYLSAVDSLIKAKQDNPTIGLLLCKTKNRVVAEYALRDANKPIGVAEYQLVHALPARLETSLPSIEQIERELKEPAGALAAENIRHEARDESVVHRGASTAQDARTKRGRKRKR
jgi:predicted nuclease of restriction endonuclease-like (RecB) superfamily